MTDRRISDGERMTKAQRSYITEWWQLIDPKSGKICGRVIYQKGFRIPYDSQCLCGDSTASADKEMAIRKFREHWRQSCRIGRVLYEVPPPSGQIPI